jgi:hypothetical protein
MSGRRTLWLIPRDTRKAEWISLALLHEAVGALPEGSELSKTLSAWMAVPEDREVKRSEVEDVESQLVAHAHLSVEKLGQVGQVRYGMDERIVADDGIDEVQQRLSSATVLSLALRRIGLLYGIGARLMLKEEPTIEESRGDRG